MALWSEPEHQCAGCIHNKDHYGPECNGCRRRTNTFYGTLREPDRYKELDDKYITLEVVSYGSHKILVKK